MRSRAYSRVFILHIQEGSSPDITFEYLKATHAEIRPVERPLMSLYSFQDSMLALCGATPSALSTSATRSRSATETTSWGPKWDLKILPYIFVCFIWKVPAIHNKLSVISDLPWEHLLKIPEKAQDIKPAVLVCFRYLALSVFIK